MMNFSTPLLLRDPPPSLNVSVACSAARIAQARPLDVARLVVSVVCTCAWIVQVCPYGGTRWSSSYLQLHALVGRAERRPLSICWFVVGHRESMCPARDMCPARARVDTARNSSGAESVAQTAAYSTVSCVQTAVDEY